jgi:hypothetical protein
MSNCPFTKKPCNELKNCSITEIINKKEEQFYCCKLCALEYAVTPETKEEVHEMLKKNDEEIAKKQNLINQIPILIKPININNVNVLSLEDEEIQEKENWSSKLKQFFKKVFSKIKFKKTKKITLRDLKLFLNKLKSDIKNDYIENNEKEIQKKQALMFNLKKDILAVRKLKLDLKDSSDPDEIKQINNIISKILKEYESIIF